MNFVQLFQMSTTPTPLPTPVPHESLLQRVGGFFKKILDIVLPFAKAEAPLFSALFPALAPLYTTTVSLVAQAEMAATAAGSQNGSGPQKLAMVVSALEPIAIQYLQSQGITADTTHIVAYVNSVVAGLNAFPAPKGSSLASSSFVPLVPGGPAAAEALAPVVTGTASN